MKEGTLSCESVKKKTEYVNYQSYKLVFKEIIKQQTRHER